jgi:SMI1 / KNR4 family (SUKH-1)
VESDDHGVAATPTSLIRQAQATTLVNEDGESLALELLPPLSPAEIDTFAARLPCPLPAEIRELLALCRGFNGPLDVVDFTGEQCSFESEDIFPHGLPIAADGFGNFWVVDLLPSSTMWGPIYFACHDAPVVLYQCATLSGFLSELFKGSQPPHESLIDDVHEDRLFQVWRKNPGVQAYEQAAQSPDPLLRAFAETLDPTFEIIDLRAAAIGFGFSWGRYGPKTIVRRHGDLPIFAVQKRAGFWSRLFGAK